MWHAVNYRVNERFAQKKVAETGCAKPIELLSFQTRSLPTNGYCFSERCLGFTPTAEFDRAWINVVRKKCQDSCRQEASTSTVTPHCFEEYVHLLKERTYPEFTTRDKHGDIIYEVTRYSHNLVFLRLFNYFH